MFLVFVILLIRIMIKGHEVVMANAEKEEVNLLLIGNSYTSSTLQDYLIDMFTENTKFSIKLIERYAPGGYKIFQHVNDVLNSNTTDLRSWLITNPPNWTWVTIQEQSIVGAWPTNICSSTESAIQLNDIIVQNIPTSNTVYMMTWGRRDGYSPTIDYLSMTDDIDMNYQRYVDLTSNQDRITKRAPVGLAFKYVYLSILEKGQDPSIIGSDFYNLYEPDGSHPSIRGIYLQACVIYMTLTGSDPRTLTRIPPNLSNTTILSNLRTAAYWTVNAESSNTDNPTMSPSNTPIEYTTIQPSLLPSTLTTPSLNPTQISLVSNTNFPSSLPSETPSSTSPASWNVSLIPTMRPTANFPITSTKPATTGILTTNPTTNLQSVDYEPTSVPFQTFPPLNHEPTIQPSDFLKPSEQPSLSNEVSFLFPSPLPSSSILPSTMMNNVPSPLSLVVAPSTNPITTQQPNTLQPTMLSSPYVSELPTGTPSKLVSKSPQLVSSLAPSKLTKSPKPSFEMLSKSPQPFSSEFTDSPIPRSSENVNNVSELSLGSKIYGLHRKRIIYFTAFSSALMFFLL